MRPRKPRACSTKHMTCPLSVATTKRPRATHDTAVWRWCIISTVLHGCGSSDRHGHTVAEAISLFLLEFPDLSRRWVFRWIPYAVSVDLASWEFKIKWAP